MGKGDYNGGSTILRLWSVTKGEKDAPSSKADRAAGLAMRQLLKVEAEKNCKQKTKIHKPFKARQQCENGLRMTTVFGVASLPKCLCEESLNRMGHL